MQNSFGSNRQQTEASPDVKGIRIFTTSSFAVRALSILNVLGNVFNTETEVKAEQFPQERTTKLVAYLQSTRDLPLNVIDTLNWLSMAVTVQAMLGIDLIADASSKWIEEIQVRLESVRTDDGGYAKSIEGAKGSTYHTFFGRPCFSANWLRNPKPKSIDSIHL